VSMPLISVMMPAWNASWFISDAIKSMQAQTYKDWQLIIVDDGSDDLTKEIAQSHANNDSRIIVDQIDHAGCPSARNKCLEIATGDIIARLDADDTHEPIRLESQVQYLLDCDVDIVTCEMTWLKGIVKLQKHVGAMDIDKYMAGESNGPVCASTVAWSRVYDVVGAFKTTQLAGSDGDWNFRAVVAGMRWGHLPYHWYNQRRHAGQLSQSMRGMQRKTHEEARARYKEQYESLRDRPR